MNQASGQEDIVFRIGGDEFALLTNSEDIHFAEEIAEKIAAQNDQPFAYNDKQIPLHLYISITKLDGNTIKYSELFTKLHTSFRQPD